MVQKLYLIEKIFPNSLQNKNFLYWIIMQEQWKCFDFSLVEKDKKYIKDLWKNFINQNNP